MHGLRHGDSRRGDAQIADRPERRQRRILVRVPHLCVEVAAGDLQLGGLRRARLQRVALPIRAHVDLGVQVGAAAMLDGDAVLPGRELRRDHQVLAEIAAVHDHPRGHLLRQDDRQRLLRVEARDS